MNKTILTQLNMLKTLEFQVDGKSSKEIPESFSNIVFLKNGNKKLISEITVVFKDYIVKPYQGFDFHDKFNKGVPPPEKIMFGCILKETEKMYFLKLRTKDNSKTWSGWCPRKSLEII